MVVTITVSVLTLFLSAYLAYFFGIQSNRSKEKDEKKKKLNKLLFHLLIVRKAASEKLNFKKRLDIVNQKQIEYLKNNIGFSDTDIESMNLSDVLEKQFNLISSSLFENLRDDSEKSKDSIKIILQEYTEIDPLFSLSLKDYDKKVKASFIEKMISESNHYDEGEIFQKYIVPQLENEMVKEIDDVIHSITSELGTKTQKEVQELLIYYDKLEVDINDFEEYLDNILLPLKSNYNQQYI